MIKHERLQFYTEMTKTDTFLCCFSLFFSSTGQWNRSRLWVWGNHAGAGKNSHNTHAAMCPCCRHCKCTWPPSVHTDLPPPWTLLCNHSRNIISARETILNCLFSTRRNANLCWDINMQTKATKAVKTLKTFLLKVSWQFNIAILSSFGFETGHLYKFEWAVFFKLSDLCYLLKRQNMLRVKS